MGDRVEATICVLKVDLQVLGSSGIYGDSNVLLTIAHLLGL